MQTPSTTRAFVIAAPATGSGKTTISLGMMAALREKGLSIQPFKVGPDYIDPGYHSRVCGRASVNLDPWLTSESFVRETFTLHVAQADMAIVEGVMGLFDGSGDSFGSTAHVAKLLDLPVLLVVDTIGSTESAAAIVLGCEEFDPDLRIMGVVLNRVGGDAHLRTLTDAIHRRCRTRVVGALRVDPALAMPERQLGLVSVFERGLDASYLQRLLTRVNEGISIEAVLKAAAVLVVPTSSPTKTAVRDIRVGVAYDEAFCFYYADNLRLLEEAGAEIVRFSALHDAALPPRLAGLYLGGGFPEEFGMRLAANRAMLDALRDFPGPLFAECGGLMALCDRLVDASGVEHNMAGRVPGVIEMTGALQGFGYREATLTRDSILGAKGTALRGHEFHWSRWRELPAEGWGIFDTARGPFGYADDNTVASYLHVHFGFRPELAKNFVEACGSRYRSR